MSDTIFAVSSGAAPAAIAVLRISGPDAVAAATTLAGPLPAARRAGLRRLRDEAGALLDSALVLVFPGPATATGEDLVELHLHGGRAIVRAVEDALGRLPGLRVARPGEFTRRALANGRIDLAQAEGLADLLQAETESARRAALAAVDGIVSGLAHDWTARLTTLSARTEALLDFADEDDVPASADAVAGLRSDIAELAGALIDAAARPGIERLRDGIRVVFAGPPNSGKSSLVNALANREVAIASPIPGTTRDRIEAPVIRDGVAYVLTDTAGLRASTDDPIEQVGIDRARQAIDAADVAIWLGDAAAPHPDMLALHPRADLPDRTSPGDRLAVSALTGQGIEQLWDEIGVRSQSVLSASDAVAFNRRQRACIGSAGSVLATKTDDLLLLAEHLRLARAAVAEVTGVVGIEAMLDDLFGRFCIGK